MQAEHTSPLAWVQGLAATFTWPALVGLAFWLGRRVQAAEARAKKAESRLESLLERHVPMIHRALAEILGHLRAR